MDVQFIKVPIATLQKSAAETSWPRYSIAQVCGCTEVAWRPLVEQCCPEHPEVLELFKKELECELNLLPEVRLQDVQKFLTFRFAVYLRLFDGYFECDEEWYFTHSAAPPRPDTC
eukprot:TRINITY_DN14075_c0_g1_i1.p1 TRINITY_DN14075_c0_g1~~TRINITY_DN14075_c0_g1_i1.p1  ORF type:complete len:127 (+),score=7.95 TRINITY_DN14075_c0_g1_i1:39-383(+)